jgi:hypothetical protein
MAAAAAAACSSAKISLTTGLAALATSVVLMLLLLRAFHKISDADSTGPSTGTIWVWSVVAVALIVAAVLTQPPSTGLSVNGLWDNVRGAATDAYYAPRAYKMKM